MELHPTPFPVKPQYVKPKSIRKIPQALNKSTKAGRPLLSEKRVFGTARNSNIPPGTAPSKKPAKAKSLPEPLKQAAKPSQLTQSPLLEPPLSETKRSSGKNKNPAWPKKKSVCFQEENVVAGNCKISGDGNAVEPQTPARSPAVRAKPRFSITPYHSAERCSKCRFDRLKTSSYWLCQIKLAETVGKHIVSAVFFRLASDCEAEPICNIRVELKKYLARHDYLNGEEEWKKLLVSYGLVKEESRVKDRDVKASLEEENASVGNQDDKDLLNEIAEGMESLNLVASKQPEKSMP